MKKILSLILILCMIPLFVSCKPAELDFEKEFIRLELLIPETYSETIELPEANEPYEVVYKIEESTLQNNELVYTIQPTNKIFVIEIELTANDITQEYFVYITQIGDQDLYELSLVDQVFYKAFLKADAYIPSVVTSNISLHMFEDDDDIDVSYYIDCSDIERGRILYTYPEQDSSCNLLTTIKYNDEERSQVIPYTMSSIEHLPRLSAIYINTDNNQWIDSNQEYTRATLSMYNNGDMDNPYLEDIPLGIRLRGNSTLWMPKKSFKLKFDDKTRLTNAYQEKDWVLLANFTDQTLVRNYVAYQMSNGLNMDFTPSYVFVDVYVNNEYLGNYMLTDQIEVTNHRVDIEENIPAIDTGYLLEYDIGLYRIGLENTDENYFLIDDIPFVIKSPQHTDDHYLTGQKEYIEDYMNLVFDTLQNEGDYSNLIDIDSFIDWFIVSEVFKNVDSGYSSVYFYKDKGGLLKMGPVWDFDLSSGNQGHLGDNERGPTGWYTPLEYKNRLFYYLWLYPEFKQALQTRWNEVYDTVILEVLDNVLEASDSITYSRYQNFERWDVIGINNEWYTSPEVLERDTYDEQVWFLYDYLHERILWMNEEINNF